MGVQLFEDQNFAGRSIELTDGKYYRNEIVDKIGRIGSFRFNGKYVLIASEKIDYGYYADFINNCENFEFYEEIGMPEVIQVMPSEKDGYIWICNSIIIQNTVQLLMPGHWERKQRVDHVPGPVVVAWREKPEPEADPRTPISLDRTVQNIPLEGDAFRQPNQVENELYQKAARQLGVVGSDFDGIQWIGNAAFERDTGWAAGTIGLWFPALLPILIAMNSMNFWCPQKRQGENQGAKRTIGGKISRPRVAGLSSFSNSVYPDNDVNFDIAPTSGFEYLLSESKKPQRTDLTKATDTIKTIKNLEKQELPDKFDEIECEIDIASDIIRDSLISELKSAELVQDDPRIQDFTGQPTVCAYGPWIYDRGHYCQPEIHPAEQIWWRVKPNITKYYGVCDQSNRFSFRSQMDGDNKQPWADCPLPMTFAYFFETSLSEAAKRFRILVRNTSAVTIEGQNEFRQTCLTYEGYNVLEIVYSPNLQTPVSFEKVTVVDNYVRGFFVIRAKLGTAVQVSTSIDGINYGHVANPSELSPAVERRLFKKFGGHLIFDIIDQTVPNPCQVQLDLFEKASRELAEAERKLIELRRKAASAPPQDKPRLIDIADEYEQTTLAERMTARDSSWAALKTCQVQHQPAPPPPAPS